MTDTAASLRTAGVFAVSLAIVAAAASSARADGDEPSAQHAVQFSLSLAAASPLDACGGGAALGEAVDRRLERKAFHPTSEADIQLLVDVDRDWQAHIVERDRAGNALGGRDVPLSAGDCPKSIETLAVVLAIMIGAPHTIAPSPPDAAVPPAILRPPEPEPKPAPPRSAPALSPLDRFEEPLRWRIGPMAELAMGTGVLPHLSFGVQGGVVVNPPLRRLSFLARVSYWPPRSTETAAAAEVDRAGGALLGCVAFLERAPASVGACAGAEAARLHSTSMALTRASESGAFLDVFGEGRVGYRFVASENVLIEPILAAQLAALLRRDRFTYRDRTGAELTLLQPSFVAFQASFGVAVHFL